MESNWKAEVMELARQAVEQGRTLCIDSYTDSKGKEHNYRLHALPSGGYTQLLKQSAAQLEDQEQPEKLANLRQRLVKLQDPDYRPRPKPYDPSDVPGVGLHQTDPQVLYLHDWQSEGEGLPVDHYVPLLKLASGKFERVWLDDAQPTPA